LNVVAPPFLEENEQVAPRHKASIVAESDGSLPHLVVPGLVLSELGVMAFQQEFFLVLEMIDRILHQLIEKWPDGLAIDAPLHSDVQLIDEINDLSVLRVQGWFVNGVKILPGDIGSHFLALQ
jgi:hypothetical protein